MKLGIHIVLCFRCSHPKDGAVGRLGLENMQCLLDCHGPWQGTNSRTRTQDGLRPLAEPHSHSEWSEENSSDAKPVFLISINNSSPSLRSMLNPRKMHLLHLWVVQLSSHGNELAALTSSASSWIHVYVARRKKHWVVHTTLNPMGITSTTLTLDQKPTKR